MAAALQATKTRQRKKGRTHARPALGLRWPGCECERGRQQGTMIIFFFELHPCQALHLDLNDEAEGRKSNMAEHPPPPSLALSSRAAGVLSGLGPSANARAAAACHPGPRCLVVWWFGGALGAVLQKRPGKAARDTFGAVEGVEASRR